MLSPDGAVAAVARLVDLAAAAANDLVNSTHDELSLSARGWRSTLRQLQNQIEDYYTHDQRADRHSGATSRRAAS